MSRLINILPVWIISATVCGKIVFVVKCPRNQSGRLRTHITSKVPGENFRVYCDAAGKSFAETYA